MAVPAPSQFPGTSPPPVSRYPSPEWDAEAADAVVVAAIVGVSLGNTVQGDAAEGVCAEVDLRIEPTDRMQLFEGARSIEERITHVRR
jgi:hypothetical protein